MKIINILFTAYLLLSFLSCKKEEVKIDYNNADSFAQFVKDLCHE